jgi:hypothetical protein
MRLAPTNSIFQGSFMFSRITTLAIVAATLLLTGCASPTMMPFSGPETATLKADKAIYLMTATMRNVNRSSHQMKAANLRIEHADGKNSDKNITYAIDTLAKDESDDPNKGSTYYLRMELDNGNYVVRGMSAMSMSFPIRGFWFVPMHAKLTPVGPGVYYLGNMDFVARSRQDGEFKAGPSLPLLDQAIAGASTSTFDVAVSDRWETDEAEFKKRFPVLNTVTVQKSILPAYDRKYAYEWWDAN